MLSGFTRQQLQPFVSVAKRQHLLTLAGPPRDPPGHAVIDRTTRDEAADTLRYVGAGHNRGKVVITACRPDRKNDPTRAYAQPDLPPLRRMDRASWKKHR